MSHLRSLLFLAAAMTALAQTPCEQMRSLQIPNTTITAAESVPNGPFARGALPAHCRVAAVLAPSPDSHIEMEIWLPPVEAWNGKFQAVGNGGWAGTITFGNGVLQPGPERTMSSALLEGYATASNDTGHKGAIASFVTGHPEKVKDFADRAVHEMTVASKQMIRAYYGSAPKFSYWNGCSTGGRQGLMEAQRHPDDFDGIVAGAPANYWTHLMDVHIWAAQATHEGRPGNMSKEKLALLHAAVLRACDALDGVKDGLLEDPRQCHFDPAALQCKGTDGPDCLTAAQVDGARKMYSGAINSRTGGQIYPGELPGSELGWDTVKGLQSFDIAQNHFRYVVFKNPEWDYRTMNFDRDVALTDETDHGLINAIDPDLRPFFAHGGKLIQYHGWNDQEISPLNSVNYYESVRRRLGNVSDSYRLFMAPGMKHCGAGDGPNQFNPMAALERWREAGVAPNEFLAVHVTDGAVDNTRPLCPYPEIAVYKGTGSIHDAGSYACKQP